MRVISGTARGLRLKSLEGSDTRPTLDKVKEAVFSMIQFQLMDAKVLDLFAGSGAMGIEALSRGAGFVDFVDVNPRACDIVKTNLSLARVLDRAVVTKSDAASFLKAAKSLGKKYDLIFLDPPYATHLLDEALWTISEYELLSDGGLIVAEYDLTTEFEAKSYNIVKSKKYGRVFINILEALQ